MEEASNVRLVRCPKCENLLPELHDFSVYQCGGCGAVLRAKKEVVSDRLSSDEEMGRGGSEKGLGVTLGSPSQSEFVECGRKAARDVLERTTNLTDSSSSMTEHKEFVDNYYQNTRTEAMKSSVDDGGKGGYVSDRYTQCLKGSASTWVHGNDHEVKTSMKGSEFGNVCVKNEGKEVKPPIGEFAGSSNLRPRPIMDEWTVKRNESQASYGIGRGRNHNDVNANMKRSESGESCIKNDVKEIQRPVRDFAGSLRSRTVMEQMNVERNGSGALYGSGGGGNDHEVYTNMKRSESGSSYVENEFKGINPPNGDFVGSLNLRSRPAMDQWSVERNGSGAFYGSDTGVAEGRMFSTFPCPGEEPSNYWPGSFHGRADQERMHNDLDGPSRVENLEHDRAELLRKLEELKDQLSRSCDVTEKPRERVPADRTAAPPPPTNCYRGHGSYDSEGPTSLYNVNVPPFPPDKHVPQPLYCNHNDGRVPYCNSRVLDTQDFYPHPRNVPNEFVGCEGSYLSQRPRRPPQQPPPQYFKQPFYDQFAGLNRDFTPSILASHPNETFPHQPACSCLQCCKNWQFRPKVPCPTISSRLPADPINPSFHHLVSHVTYGPQSYNSRCAHPYLNSLTRQPQTRSSSDFDLDTGGLGLRHPRTVVIAHGSKRVCQPIAGGAPFFTCRSCFEFLKLPTKLKVPRKNQQKVRCGACSAVILLQLQKEGIVISNPTQLKKVSPKVGDGETSNGNFRRSSSCLNAGTTNSWSDDCDCRFDFQLTDEEPNILSTNQILNFGESNEREDLLYSSSSLSEAEQSPDSVISEKENSYSADKPAKDDVPIVLPDSTHQKDPDNGSSNYVVNKNGLGNESKRNDQEKSILDKYTVRQNSVKDVLVATEMEVSYDGLPNAMMSQDFTEESKEDRPRINKGSESFFAGLIRKNFKDFSKSSQSVDKGRSNILVNGQPIPDRAVKKAEKLSGPIQPGSYWYDFRAGFWGVMGQPCSGIIPPYIEQFNYPMPENCAAGNTGVFVNGRELHQKDLDLLSGRGLPTERDKSYIIEISGRILDEDTGEELDNLGKLAPTVERAKHGFGMKVPKTLAE